MTATNEALPEATKDRLTACVDVLGRTGAADFQLRFQDEPEPTVWIAVVGYKREGDPKSGNPAKREARMVYEAAASILPDVAALRLCDQVIDGGICTHCGRPSGITEDWDERMPLDDLICWYQYDPEVKKFRRSCEGQ